MKNVENLLVPSSPVKNLTFPCFFLQVLFVGQTKQDDVYIHIQYIFLN